MDKIPENPKLSHAIHIEMQPLVKQLSAIEERINKIIKGPTWFTKEENFDQIAKSLDDFDIQLVKGQGHWSLSQLTNLGFYISLVKEKCSSPHNLFPGLAQKQSSLNAKIDSLSQKIDKQASTIDDEALIDDDFELGHLMSFPFEGNSGKEDLESVDHLRHFIAEAAAKTRHAKELDKKLQNDGRVTREVWTNMVQEFLSDAIDIAYSHEGFTESLGQVLGSHSDDNKQLKGLKKSIEDASKFKKLNSNQIKETTQKVIDLIEKGFTQNGSETGDMPDKLRAMIAMLEKLVVGERFKK